jgi:hypothetical protein
MLREGGTCAGAAPDTVPEQSKNSPTMPGIRQANGAEVIAEVLADQPPSCRSQNALGLGSAYAFREIVKKITKSLA